MPDSCPIVFDYNSSDSFYIEKYALYTVLRHKGKLNNNTKKNKVSTKWVVECGCDALWWRFSGLKKSVGIFI